MNIKNIFFSVILMTFIISCKMTGYDYESDKTDESIPGTSEDSQLFEYHKDTGSFVFSINDTKYLQDSGYTIWCSPNINEEKTFEPIEVTVSKSSGKTDTGYGLVFCNQVIKEKQFMLTIMINNKGQFIIGEVYEGVFQRITEWKSNKALIQGVGVNNRIRIEHDDNRSVYKVFLNSELAMEFSTRAGVIQEGSEWGYVAVISNEENFPEIPVTVSYRREI